MSRRLLKSTASVSSMTMLSRILGFVRDMVLARVFGASAGTDAFFIAFKIPNFMRRLFAEGAFSQAFVPVLSEYKSQREESEVRRLVSDVTGTLGGFLFMITVIGVLASPLLIYVFAPGFTGKPEKFAMTAHMLRITFPYILFISITALFSGVLNTFGKFVVPAFTPVFLNLSLLAAAIWLAPHMQQPIVALAWGVFIAGIIQLSFQLPHVARLGVLGWPRWAWHQEGIQRIVKLMVPAILGSSVAQINLLIDTILASLLVTGSVTWLYYSDRLMEFPLGVFGVALGTVILPSLSKSHAEKSSEEFSSTLDWALRWAILIGTPAMTGLLILSGPMLATLFMHGKFTPPDVRMTQLSLMAFSIGLMGFILVKVLQPGYYSRQDTRTPMRIGIRAVIANMVLNVIFVVPMVVYHVPGAHAGLASATSISAFIQTVLLYRGLRREGVLRPGPGWWLLLLRVLLANTLMGLALWFGSGDLTRWFQMDSWQRVAQLSMWIAIGGGIYLLTLFATGVRPRDLLMRKSEQA